jgi:hypothetical protein
VLGLEGICFTWLNRILEYEAIFFDFVCEYKWGVAGETLTAGVKHHQQMRIRMDVVQNIVSSIFKQGTERFLFGTLSMSLRSIRL